MLRRLIGIALVISLLAACSQQEQIVIPTVLDLNMIASEQAATTQAQAATAAALVTATREPLPPTWTPTDAPSPAPTTAPDTALLPAQPTATTPPPATGMLYYIFNGNTIAYASADGANQGVLSVSQTGSRIADLTASPDGTGLLYVGQSAANTREIFRADLTTTTITAITQLGFGRVFSPVYRPDGEMIAFFASPNPEGPLDIYVATAAGNGVRQVAQTNRAVQNSLTWGSDNSNLVFYTDQWVFAVDTESGARYQLTAEDAIGTYTNALHHPYEPILLFLRDEPVVTTGYFGAFLYRLGTQTLIDFPEKQVDARPGNITSIRWGSDGALLLLLGRDRLIAREWAGGRISEIVVENAAITDAVAHPDGALMAYAAGQGAAQQIFITPRDDSAAPIQITNHAGGTISNLVWLRN